MRIESLEPGSKERHGERTRTPRTDGSRPLLRAARRPAFAFAAQSALAAHPGDTWKHGSATSCTSCHASISGPGATADNTLCTKCHDYVAHTLKRRRGRDCWSACHTPGQDLSTVATNAGCGVAGAAAGCHGAGGHPGLTPTTCVTCHGDGDQSAHHHAALTDVSVKPVLTAAMSAKTIKLGKTFKVAGLAKPVNASYKVTLLIQKKSPAPSGSRSRPRPWPRTPPPTSGR